MSSSLMPAPSSDGVTMTRDDSYESPASSAPSSPSSTTTVRSPPASSASASSSSSSLSDTAFDDSCWRRADVDVVDWSVDLVSPPRHSPCVVDRPLFGHCLAATLRRVAASRRARRRLGDALGVAPRGEDDVSVVAPSTERCRAARRAVGRFVRAHAEAARAAERVGADPRRRREAARRACEAERSYGKAVAEERAAEEACRAAERDALRRAQRDEEARSAATIDALAASLEAEGRTPWEEEEEEKEEEKEEEEEEAVDAVSLEAAVAAEVPEETRALRRLRSARRAERGRRARATAAAVARADRVAAAADARARAARAAAADPPDDGNGPAALSRVRAIARASFAAAVEHHAALAEAARSARGGSPASVTDRDAEEGAWRAVADAGRRVGRARAAAAAARERSDRARDRVGSLPPSERRVHPLARAALSNVFSLSPEAGRALGGPGAERAVAEGDLDDEERGLERREEELRVAEVELAEAVEAYARCETPRAEQEDAAERVTRAVDEALRAHASSRLTATETAVTALRVIDVRDDSRQWSRLALEDRDRAERERGATDDQHETPPLVPLSDAVRELLRSLSDDDDDDDDDDDPTQDDHDHAASSEEPAPMAQDNKPTKNADDKLAKNDDDKLTKNDDDNPTNTVADTLASSSSRRSVLKLPFVSSENDLFLSHFWADNDDPPPRVIESYSCAYFPPRGAPLRHGRMFVSSDALRFVGWGDKKVVLHWRDVTDVTKGTMLLVDNSLVFSVRGEEQTHHFASFVARENCWRLVRRLMRVARDLEGLEETDEEGPRSAPRTAPARDVLSDATIVLDRELPPAVTLDAFYETCVVEAADRPFYGPHLVADGRVDVVVGPWEDTTADADAERRVSFALARRSLAARVAVRQTHLRRRTADRVELESASRVEGVPYADAFEVVTTWAADTTPEGTVRARAGVRVEFFRSTLFESRVRAQALRETTEAAASWYEAMERACAGGGTAPSTTTTDRPPRPWSKRAAAAARAAAGTTRRLAATTRKLAERAVERGARATATEWAASLVATARAVAALFLAAAALLVATARERAARLVEVGRAASARTSERRRASSPNDPPRNPTAVVVVVVLVVVVLVLSRTIRRPPTPPDARLVPRSEFDALSRRLDDAAGEIRRVRELLEEVRDALSERKVGETVCVDASSTNVGS